MSDNILLDSQGMALGSVHEPCQIQTKESSTDQAHRTINTFVLAAACYPEHIRRAQAELDNHMSSKYDNRYAVPIVEDLEKLQLLAALVKETLRLTPTGSSGVGHTPTTAEPLSFFIKAKGPESEVKVDVPARSTVLANIYGLHHDAAAFPDPWQFNPDRWLCSQPNEASKCNALDHTRSNFAFGFGRRICPGSTLASYSLSIAIALLLMSFEFELTDTAQTLCTEMENQICEESKKWVENFPDRGHEALARERSSRERYDDDRDRIGKILIDSHIVFKLSKEQLDQCVCLKVRDRGSGLRAVQHTLATFGATSA